MAHNPQQIINTANSFLLAAGRALEQRPLGPGQFQMLLVPAVVSTAFAVELYFKAIITLENGNARGHDLSTLFSRISISSQDKLVAAVQDNGTDIEKKLKAISSAFVEWRYIFEREYINLDFSFLTNLAHKSKQVAEEMARATIDTDAAR